MADGKGIPMRRQREDPRPRDPRHLREGEKKNKKRMAYVGVSYTVERNRRDVAEVVGEIFGAQAMLATRATWANDHWKDFCQFRSDRETERLYPYRQTIQELWN